MKPNRTSVVCDEFFLIKSDMQPSTTILKCQYQVKTQLPWLHLCY